MVVQLHILSFIIIIMMSTFIAFEIIMITFIASIIIWDFMNWGQPTVVHVYNVMYSTHK